jgi:hypothetical protein
MKAFNEQRANEDKDRQPDFVVECPHIKALREDDSDHHDLWLARRDTAELDAKYARLGMQVHTDIDGQLRTDTFVVLKQCTECADDYPNPILWAVPFGMLTAAGLKQLMLDGETVIPTSERGKAAMRRITN